MSKKLSSGQGKSGLDVSLIEKTFNILSRKGDLLVKRFYDELFKKYPQVKPLFGNVSIKEQQKKLLAALSLVVKNIRNPEALGEILSGLGMRHQKYGAKPEHYQAVAGTLLGVMEEVAGDIWTDEVHEAWAGALNAVASIMLKAYSKENSSMSTRGRKSTKIVHGNAVDDEMMKMKSAVAGAMTPIMMVDRNLEITYANEATISLLSEHEQTLRSLYLGFDVKNLVGTCIDIFHKNPAHQRRILSDPGNLPYSTDIKVGPLTFRINVTALMDDSGEYIGNCLEWSDVTALRQKENEVVRLQSSVEGAMTAIMMIDRDLVITYANKSTVSLLSEHEQTLRSIYPGFNVKNLVGTCIDIFHKNPAHQRKILNDPANLPYSTDIKVGPLTFRINVTALTDNSGKYTGNCLEWSDVTALRQKENEVVRLHSSVEGAMTPIMMIDRNLVITYANNSTVSLLSKHEQTLRSTYPGFNVNNLIGSCIDMFHKNPAHQRKLLSDPGNLPYSADIKVGPLIFRINVTALHDAAGEYIGNCLEWHDVTEVRQKEEKNADYAGQIGAISKAQAIIEFNMDGTIIGANENFLNTLGYSLKEIQGQHHSMFAEPSYRQSVEYRSFWEKLNRGEYDAGQYKRIGKGGKEIWIQASYNPIFDLNGKPFKVVKYATDISQQKDAEHQMQVLINSALAGKLDERIDVSGYEGSTRQSAENINKLMDAIVSPIRESTRVLGLLAQGDLTNHMDGNYQGEFSSLRDSINTSIENLFKMVADIRETTTNISSAATEIAQGNSDLSQRTEEQASSLEETASSMEELTSTVKQNADNARQANQLAASARDQAEKGGEVVGSAISAMAAINSSSKKISDIIGVIDEIAFQTNLLALNAAVEAARAGEQGRGFAVVAAEVRNLAQRSATAAKEIKSLIKDSVEKVDEGSRLVDASGKTLTEIVGSVKKVSDIIAEIAAASQEQSAGIDQVNKAVMQMDEVTQQNAALVEEAAAASEAMDEQAQGLKKLISFFKVDDQGGEGSRMEASSGARPAARASGGKGGSSSGKAPMAARGGSGLSSSKAPAAAPKGNAKPKTVATASMDDAEWEEF
ncbi:MAG: PAS domain-containing protein [Gammaproteobacteria bacterium]|nr:PAS domain-containing protein [Gammaproteobacteria bacterium]